MAKQKDWGLDTGTHIDLSAAKVPSETSTRIVAQQQVAPDGAAQLVEIERERLGVFLRTIHQVCHAALSTLKPGPLMAQVLGAVGRELPGVRGCVLWRIEETAGFHRVAHHPREAAPPAISRTVVHHVVETRSAVLCEDAQLDGRLRGSRSIKMSQARSVLAAPIIIGDRVEGMILLDHKGASHFDQSDLVLINAVAATVASAVAAVDVRAELVTDRVAQGVRDTLRASTIGAGLTTGMRAGELSLAIGLVGTEPEASVFADAVTVRGRDGRAAAVVGLGEVASGMAVGAVRAQTVVRSLAKRGAPPMTILDEIGETFNAHGIPPRGNAIILAFDPAEPVLRAAIAGEPALIVHRRGEPVARAVPPRAVASHLGAPVQGAPMAIPLDQGDTLVLVSGAVAAEGGATLPRTLGHAIARGDDDPAKLAASLVAQTCLHVDPDVRGALLVIRRT